MCAAGDVSQCSTKKTPAPSQLYPQGVGDPKGPIGCGRAAAGAANLGSLIQLSSIQEIITSSGNLKSIKVEFTGSEVAGIPQVHG